MKPLKAIPTYYNGMKFDSRTEARWAVFFDTLGIPYVHEPEGFVFSDGTRYLPDFYLPDQKAFFECKGILSEVDARKINMLMSESGHPVIIGYSDFTFESCDVGFLDNEVDEAYTRTTKDSSVLVKCGSCGKYYFSGINGYYGCQCCNDYDGDHYFHVVMWGDPKWGRHDYAVRNALNAALSKKFDKREDAV